MARLTVYGMGGGDEYGKSGHLSIFSLLKRLDNAIKVQFSEGFMFTLV